MKVHHAALLAALMSCKDEAVAPPPAPAPAAPIAEVALPWDPAQSPAEVAAARAALPTLVGEPLAALCFVESKVCYLLDPDGGFRIQAADGRVLAEPLRSRSHPGVTHLPPTTMQEAVALVDAAALGPDGVPLVRVTAGPAPSRQLRYQTVAWVLRSKGEPRVILAQVVPGLPQTHGPLEGLARFFGDQLLGDWMNE
jgi:hypothetical protein